MSSKKKKYCLPPPTPSTKLISGPTSGSLSAFYKTDLEGTSALLLKEIHTTYEKKIQSCLEIVPIPAAS